MSHTKAPDLDVKLFQSLNDCQLGIGLTPDWSVLHLPGGALTNQELAL